MSSPPAKTHVSENRTDPAFLLACNCRKAPYVPVWFMRQAGRSLPEYRELRSRGTILEAIMDPSVAAEITLQPIRRYGVDAAILFSDIVVPLVAVGLEIEVSPGTGPVLAKPFRSRSDLSRLRPLVPEEDMAYVIDAVKLLRSELPTSIPLIGFAGGPFTLASYLVEGGPSKDFALTKAFMWSEPVLWREFLDLLAEIALSSLLAQVDAGARAVQVFDSWVGGLSPDAYARFVLPSARRIFDGLRALSVPSIHFGVGTGELLSLMGLAGANVVGVDWRVPLDIARQRVGQGRAVQGNLDPAVCLAAWPVVAREVRSVLKSAGSAPGHIFNLGHGVLPSTDPGILKAVVDLVHGESTK